MAISKYLWRTPLYNLEAHQRLVHGLYEKYPLTTPEQCSVFVQSLMIAAFGEKMPWLLVEEIDQLLLDLFSANDLFFLDEPTSTSREILDVYQRELDPTRAPAAYEAAMQFLKSLPLPQTAYEKKKPTGPTVPLAALIPNLREHVTFAIHTAINTKHGQERLFPSTAQALTEKIHELSGAEIGSSRKLTMPSDYDGDPTDYLGGTPFDALFNAQVPFLIPRKAWGEHGAIFGKAGHGKTQTLRAILAGFLQEDDPPALFVIDSLGSLIEGIPDLEIFSTRLKDRLVILDAADPQHMPALNFFNLQSDDLCFYLFKAIDQSFTARQATMISYLMELMRAVKGANLLTLINVCESKENPHPDVVANLSPFAQSFFQNQFYAKKQDPLVAQTKAQIASRIYTLARMPKFEQIFSATENVFDPYKCMQEKKIVVINTDARPPRLGGLGEQASAVFGRFILALCLDAARGRPKDQRHLALLVVDEAKAYMDEHAALILSDARQFGLGMLLASQFPHQLEEGVRREVNTNTSVRLMGPVEYAVASQYARDMFTTPEMIMRMKSYDRSHTEWCTYVSNMTEKAVKLDIPFGLIEKMPKRTRPTIQELPKPIQEALDGLDKLTPAKEPPPPTPPIPKTHEAPQSEPSLRDADLPPSAVPKRAESDRANEPLIKPGKDW